MSGPSTISRGNIDIEMIMSVNIAAGTVNTNTASIVTVSVPGILPGDFLSVSPQEYLWPAAQPAINMTADSAWCATPNVLTVSITGNTGATATQTTPVAYVLNVARSNNFSINQTLPSALV